MMVAFSLTLFALLGLFGNCRSDDWENTKLAAWTDLENAVGIDQLNIAFPTSETFTDCIDHEMDTTRHTLAIGCMKYGHQSTPEEFGNSYVSFVFYKFTILEIILF